MEKFGNLKDTFNKIIFESVIQKDKKGKKVFSKFLTTLKENKNLSDQFLIYKNLQSKKFETIDDAKEYVKENITLLKGLNENVLNKGNVFFKKLLGSKKIVTENDSFYSSIEYLVKTKKSPSNIEKMNECISNISNTMLIKEEKEETTYQKIDLPLNVVSDLALKKFNNRYSNLNESEKEILKTLLNGNEDEKMDVYKNLKKECVDSVNTKLNETTDISLKEKLLQVKDKILSMEFNTENLKEDIVKLYDLNKSLK